MVTAQDCFKKYGEPSITNPWMTIADLPVNHTKTELGHFPIRIWCNKDLVTPLANAINNLIERGYIKDIATFDGCFNIRKVRGRTSMSLHSWGIAIDINAFENQLGTDGKFSAGFVKCFTDAGFDWGGNFKSRKDPMHFQLTKI